MKLKLVLSVLVIFYLLTLRAALAREWTNSSGTYKLEAELVKLDGEIVHLKKADGAIIKIPLSKLCDDDRKFIQQQPEPTATSGKAATQPPAAANDKVEERPADEIESNQTIATDVHRSRVDKKQHLSPEYVLRSNRPQQVGQTSIRFRATCRSGWTTSGDVEASIDGGKWTKVGSWNPSTIDEARSKGDWHTVPLRSKSQATEIRVRFVQRDGEHSLAVNAVVWNSDSASVAVAGRLSSEAITSPPKPVSTQAGPANADTAPTADEQQEKLLEAKQKKLEQLQKDLERMKNLPKGRGTNYAGRVALIESTIDKLKVEIDAGETDLIINRSSAKVFQADEHEDLPPTKLGAFEMGKGLKLNMSKVPPSNDKDDRFQEIFRLSEYKGDPFRRPFREGKTSAEWSNREPYATVCSYRVV